jgi:4-hydroxy-4-methyl-2-oxoglutarate aldolase
VQAEGLTSAFVADALDSVGLASRCLGPDIRMLSGDRALVGRAVTASTAPMVDEPRGEDRYTGLKELLHLLGPGDVIVLATDRCDDYATWGELVSIAALRAGGLGIATDGLVRDLDRVGQLQFRVFARGTRPTDIGGRADVVGIGDPVLIDEVRIETGDLIVGDIDGVAVVPRAVADVVTQHALEVGIGERHFHEALDAGMPIWEAFERFHAL